MEIRLTLRPGMPGTKRLVARYGERLVCVRYLYDEIRSRRLKTVERVIEETPWRGRARRPRQRSRSCRGEDRVERIGVALRGETGGRHLAPEAKALGNVLGSGARTRHRSSGGHWMSTASVQIRSI